MNDELNTPAEPARATPESEAHPAADQQVTPTPQSHSPVASDTVQPENAAHENSEPQVSVAGDNPIEVSPAEVSPAEVSPVEDHPDELGSVAEEPVEVGPVADVDASSDDGPSAEDGPSADDEVAADDDDEVAYDPDAPPAEPLELIEEAPEAEESEKDWYILKVQVNREKSICDALKRRVNIEGLEAHFGEILVPTEDVREFTKSGKQRIVKRKLYPGYIVVQMAITDDTWFVVRETPGIGDFTGAAGKPSPLEKREIDRILRASNLIDIDEGDEQESIKTAIKFKQGDRVRVKEGYFQNFEGDIDAIDESNGRITVMINIFGRATPVELDHWQVEDV